MALKNADKYQGNPRSSVMSNALQHASVSRLPILPDGHALTERSLLVKQLYEASAQLIASLDDPIVAKSTGEAWSNPTGWTAPTVTDLRLALRMRAMLLDLAAVKAEGEEISVSAVCISSGAPQSTALRKLASLEAAGLIRRIQDDRDRRRISVELTEAGSEFVIGGLKESAAFFQKLGKRG
jgi:DNA-binding transcriptional ArsR family regulator